MIFGKFLSAEEIKAAKQKKKERKDLIFELTQNSIVHKLREDVELLTARANHWESEWFNLKKTHEILTGQLQTIAGADQELKAEMYEMTKVISFKDETISEYERLTEKSIDKIAELTEENESLKFKVLQYSTIITDELTTDETNDQINELLKSK